MPTFSDCYVEHKTRLGGIFGFMLELNEIIDWTRVSKLIDSYYRPSAGGPGRPAYSGLLIFKMLLVGIWNGGASDERVEAMSNDSLVVMKFLGLSLEDALPDHSVLSRFRTKLSKAHAWDSLLEEINRQMDEHGAMAKGAVIIDGSVTISQRHPKHKPTYEVVDERAELGDETEAIKYMKVMEVKEPGVDGKARWTIKNGKAQFGYKQNMMADPVGKVIRVVTKPANTHDSQSFDELVQGANLPPNTRVCADKAYHSQRHKELLEELKLKNGILMKATRGKPLRGREIQRNKLISKIRYVVERTFGSQVRWFGSKILRYCGLEKAHAWHILQAIGYNLKRFPKLRAIAMG